MFMSLVDQVHKSWSIGLGYTLPQEMHGSWIKWFDDFNFKKAFSFYKDIFVCCIAETLGIKSSDAMMHA